MKRGVKKSRKLLLFYHRTNKRNINMKLNTNCTVDFAGKLIEVAKYLAESSSVDDEVAMKALKITASLTKKDNFIDNIESAYLDIVDDYEEYDEYEDDGSPKDLLEYLNSAYLFDDFNVNVCADGRVAVSTKILKELANRTDATELVSAFTPSGIDGKPCLVIFNNDEDIANLCDGMLLDYDWTIRRPFSVKSLKNEAAKGTSSYYIRQFSLGSEAGDSEKEVAIVGDCILIF